MYTEVSNKLLFLLISFSSVYLFLNCIWQNFYIVRTVKFWGSVSCSRTRWCAASGARESNQRHYNYWTTHSTSRATATPITIDIISLDSSSIHLNLEKLCYKNIEVYVWARIDLWPGIDSSSYEHLFLRLKSPSSPGRPIYPPSAEEAHRAHVTSTVKR